jgi:hypothetical protein
MTARATASLLFLLIARAASADDECAGGSCPVPSHFASAAPPEAPEFDVHELSDDGAWSKVATEHSVNAGADAEEEEEEGELDLGTETETMSMEDFKKMTTTSATAGGVSEKVTFGLTSWKRPSQTCQMGKSRTCANSCQERITFVGGPQRQIFDRSIGTTSLLT